LHDLLSAAAEDTAQRLLAIARPPVISNPTHASLFAAFPAVAKLGM